MAIRYDVQPPARGAMVYWQTPALPLLALKAGPPIRRAPVVVLCGIEL